MPLFFFPAHAAGTRAVREGTETAAPMRGDTDQVLASPARLGPYSSLFLKHVPFCASSFEMDVLADLSHTLRAWCHHDRPRRHQGRHTDEMLVLLADTACAAARVTRIATSSQQPWPSPPAGLPPGLTPDVTTRAVTSAPSAVLSSNRRAEDVGPVLTYALPSLSLHHRLIEKDACWLALDDTSTAAAGARGGQSCRTLITRYRADTGHAFLDALHVENDHRRDAFRAWPAHFPNVRLNDVVGGVPPGAAAWHTMWTTHRLRCSRPAPRLVTPLNAEEEEALWIGFTGHRGGGGGDWLCWHSLLGDTTTASSPHSAPPPRAAEGSELASTFRDHEVSLLAPWCVGTAPLLPVAMHVSSTHTSVCFSDSLARSFCSTRVPPLSTTADALFIARAVKLGRVHLPETSSDAPPSLVSPRDAFSPPISTPAPQEAQPLETLDECDGALFAGCHASSAPCADPLAGLSTLDDDGDGSIARRLWLIELSQRHTQASVCTQQPECSCLSVDEAHAPSTTAQCVAQLLPFTLTDHPRIPLTTEGTPMPRHVTVLGGAGITAEAVALTVLRVSTHLCLPWRRPDDGAHSSSPPPCAAIRACTPSRDPGLRCLSPFSGFRTTPLLGVTVAVSDGRDDTASTSPPCVRRVCLPTLRNLAADTLRKRWPHLRRWHRCVLGARHATAARAASPSADGHRIARTLLATQPVNSVGDTKTRSTPRPHQPSEKSVRFLLSLRRRATSVDWTRRHVMALSDVLLRIEVDPFNPRRSLYEAEVRSTRLADKVKAVNLLLAEKSVHTSASPLWQAQAITLGPYNDSNGAASRDTTEACEVNRCHSQRVLDQWVRTGVAREGALLFSSFFYDLLELSRTPVAGVRAESPDASDIAPATDIQKPHDEQLWMMESDDESSDVEGERANGDHHHQLASGWWDRSLAASTRFMGLGTRSVDPPAERVARDTDEVESEDQGWTQLAADLLTHGPCHPLFRHRVCRAVVPRHVLAEQMAYHAQRECVQLDVQRCLRTLPTSRTKRRQRSRSPATATGSDTKCRRCASPCRTETPPTWRDTAADWLPGVVRRALSDHRALDSAAHTDPSNADVARDAVKSTFGRLIAEWEAAEALRTLYARADAQRRRLKVYRR